MSRSWSRSEKNIFFAVDIVVKKMWFKIHSFIDNDTRHQWSKFVADSLGCASWVHNILTTVITRIVVDKTIYHAKPNSICWIYNALVYDRELVFICVRLHICENNMLCLKAYNKFLSSNLVVCQARGSKSINMLSHQWGYHFYPNMCAIYIIFDQPARSIFITCRALVIWYIIFLRFHLW